MVEAPEHISQEEKKEFADWIVKTYDFNHDRQVDYEEFLFLFISDTEEEISPVNHPSVVFKQFDNDGDGFISGHCESPRRY